MSETTVPNERTHLLNGNDNNDGSCDSSSTQFEPPVEGDVEAEGAHEVEHEATPLQLAAIVRSVSQDLAPEC